MMQLNRISQAVVKRTILQNHAVKSFSCVAAPRLMAGARGRDQTAGLFLLGGGTTTGLMLGSTTPSTQITRNHCQVPCGIFDDPAMVAETKQAAATIRKSMVQSQELHATAGSDLLAMNQMTRWILTKEEHANKIITLVSEYCLCQRVKTEVFASDEEYVQALKAHHTVMQCAMKAKQQMDTAACDALDHAIEDFAKMYIK